MPKTITGNFTLPNGNPASSCIIAFQLSQDAAVLNTTQIAPQVSTFQLTVTGALPPGAIIYANDELTPNNTTYTITVTAPGGGRIWGPETFFLSGASPINLNSFVPGTIGVSSIPAGPLVIFVPLTVAFTATMIFDASKANYFITTLTGNVTSSTLINTTPGQPIVFELIQDGVGARTFSWPGAIINPTTIDPGIGAKTFQLFIAAADGSLLTYPLAMATIN